MNLEEFLTKLQVERQLWKNRAAQEFSWADKAFEDLEIQLKHLRQASYDQGVAWGLYLATTLISQEQMQQKGVKWMGATTNQEQAMRDDGSEHITAGSAATNAGSPTHGTLPPAVAPSSPPHPESAVP